MKILVTGSTGFVGKNLIAKIGTDDNVIFINEGDLSEKGILNRLDPYGIEHIFHLASKISIKESWEKPHEYYRTNVLGTINVLEFARKNNCKLTYMSSYVYGEPDYLPIDEKHPVKGFNPYCQTKISSESLCNLYAKNYGINITIFRAFNIYGKGQKSLLIPILTDMLYSDLYKEIEVPNDNIKRDYINIEDVTDVLKLSMNHPGGIYNLGSGMGITVKEIINNLCILTDIHKPIRLKSRGLSNEILTIVADIQKLKNDFNWAPQVDIKTGLKEYIYWYQNNINK
jgi:nucleoside-diphosphate-sugar epimerase